MTSALTGIRVLDLSRLLPGPYCSLILADFGAEVIKIEAPEGGDYLRRLGQGTVEDSAIFRAFNRNKKSVTLNLKSDEGKRIFLDLVKTADVLLESFRPGVMARLGLDYKALRAVNPRLIYCSLTGYGQEGPYRHRAGHDLNYIALGGVLASLSGKGEPPVIPGVQIADLTGGMWAALSILLALAARWRTGQGQHVDVSLLDSAVALLTPSAAVHFAPQPGRWEEMLTGRTLCYHVYETKDGQFMTLAALEPKFWAAFCTAVGREDLIPAQFAAAEEGEAAYAELRAIFRSRTREEWEAFLAGQENVCCEPVNSLAQVFGDPQVAARRIRAEVAHPVEGATQQLATPPKLSRTPGRVRRPAPRLGEHTVEVLKELGYGVGEIERLREQGVI